RRRSLRLFVSREGAVQHMRMSGKSLWDDVSRRVRAAQERMPSPAQVLGSVWERKTYRNLVYILTAAPLGMGYALLLVAGPLLRLLQIVLQAIASTLTGLVAIASRLTRLIIGIVRALVRFLMRLAVLSLVVAGLILLWWLVIPIVLLLLVHALWLRWRAARQGSSFGERASTSRLAPLYAWLARLFRWLVPSFSLADSRAWMTRFFRVRAPVPEPVGPGSTRKQNAVVPAIWRRLVDYERRFTVRWLDVDIPPVSQGEADDDPFVWSSLLYLLMKIPLGVVGWVFAFFAAIIIGWLLSQPLFVLFNDPVNWLLERPAIFLFSQSGQGLLALFMVTFAVLFAGLGLILIPPALYVLNVLAAAAGNLACLMLTPSDTARRLREAEVVAAQERAKAERAEQVRHDLIVNVSHELRTPLANIRGHIESLLWALDEPEEENALPRTLRSYLSIVHRETESLRTLVDELLALAHAESNKLHLTLAPVDAGDVVEEVYQSLAPLARSERRVTVARTVEPDLPAVLADRQRLTQVLLNLVRNAIAYTPEGGIVAITLQRGDAGHLLLAVADTGIGISEEELDHVFDRFYRTDASRERASDGFGLGLAIAQDLVTAMGGAISVESKVGEGSCFQLRLQVAESSEGEDVGA
ncbi:MAG: HAMP domain-containing histidine kinase, partial [Chloroflexota bacterium]|nr:HAMP domain-containing histidine kinase [Chloroflexota bacterium]